MPLASPACRLAVCTRLLSSPRSTRLYASERSERLSSPSPFSARHPHTDHRRRFDCNCDRFDRRHRVGLGWGVRITSRGAGVTIGGGGGSHHGRDGRARHAKHPFRKAIGARGFRMRTHICTLTPLPHTRLPQPPHLLSIRCHSIRVCTHHPASALLFLASPDAVSRDDSTRSKPAAPTRRPQTQGRRPRIKSRSSSSSRAAGLGAQKPTASGRRQHRALQPTRASQQEQAATLGPQSRADGLRPLPPPPRHPTLAAAAPRPDQPTDRHDAAPSQQDGGSPSSPQHRRRPQLFCLRFRAAAAAAGDGEFAPRRRLPFGLLRDRSRPHPFLPLGRLHRGGRGPHAPRGFLCRISVALRGISGRGCAMRRFRLGKIGFSRDSR